MGLKHYFKCINEITIRIFTNLLNLAKKIKLLLLFAPMQTELDINNVLFYKDTNRFWFDPNY